MGEKRLLIMLVSSVWHLKMSQFYIVAPSEKVFRG